MVKYIRRRRFRRRVRRIVPRIRKTVNGRAIYSRAPRNSVVARVFRKFARKVKAAQKFTKPTSDMFATFGSGPSLQNYLYINNPSYPTNNSCALAEWL